VYICGFSTGWFSRLQQAEEGWLSRCHPGKSPWKEIILENDMVFNQQQANLQLDLDVSSSSYESAGSQKNAFARAELYCIKLAKH